MAGKPIFDGGKLWADPGGSEYSGRRPSPKLYEADNEVCRIGGSLPPSINSFTLQSPDYASLVHGRRLHQDSSRGSLGCFSHSLEVHA